MLRKLLKYDMRRANRFGVPILIALGVLMILGIAAVGGFFFLLEGLYVYQSSAVDLFFVLVLFFLMMLLYLILFAPVIHQILLYVDFYKSIGSDEAYLTFTLPVTPKQLLGSKYLTALIWTFLLILAAIIVVCVALFGGSLFYSVLSEIFGDTVTDSTVTDSTVIEPILSAITFGDVINTILGLGCAVAYVCNNLMLYFMAIFYGTTIAKKQKALAAIGCVILVNILYSVVGYVVQFIALISFDAPIYVWNIFLALGILALAGLTVLFYFLTVRMMERKLNLA